MDYIEYNLFSSCFQSFDDIQSDSFLGKSEMRTIFRIECVTGKNITNHSYYHDIKEILLLPNTQFEVTDRTHSHPNLWMIHLKELKSGSTTSYTLSGATKRQENKPYSAPSLSSTSASSSSLLLSSKWPNATCSSSTQRSRSFYTLSSSNIEVEQRKTSRTAKSYENESLKELMSKARKQESIRLSKQFLNYDDMELISMELASNKYWKQLYLWENFINEKHMMALVHGLELNSTLICLNLDCNKLGDKGTSILASILENNNSLRSLHLNDNEISESGVVDLSQMLCVNKTLTHVELSSNSIGDDGVAALCNALKVNKSLRSICLSANRMTAIGAEHLAEMLKVNRTLTDLDLSSNNIGDEGVSMIVGVIEKKNRTLEALRIGRTMITIDCMNDIGDMVERNTRLKCLHLNDNNLGDDAMKIMFGKLKKNSGNCVLSQLKEKAIR